MIERSQIDEDRQKDIGNPMPLEDSTSQAVKTTPTSDLRKTGIHPDYWSPLACSRDLKKGKMLGMSFAGDPIVLVRTKSGGIYAL